MASKIKVSGGLNKRWLSSIGRSDAVTAVTKEAYGVAKQNVNSQSRALCERAGLRTVYDATTHRYLAPREVTSFCRGNAQRGVWNTTYTLWPTFRSSKLTQDAIQNAMDAAGRATGATLKRRH